MNWQLLVATLLLTVAMDVAAMQPRGVGFSDPSSWAHTFIKVAATMAALALILEF